MAAETPRAANSLSLRLEELGRQVASTRTAAEEAVADAGRKAIGDVLDAVARLEEAKDQSAVLTTLLEAGGSFASRTAFFLTRPGTVRGWGGHGFGAVSLKALQELSFDSSEESPWTEFVEGRGVVHLGSKDCERLSQRLGAEPAKNAILVPFVLRGQLGGALYADQLEDGPKVMSESSLQLLTHSAARAIETLPFREHGSPTLRINTASESRRVPLWQPAAEESPPEPEAIAEPELETVSHEDEGAAYSEPEHIEVPEIEPALPEIVTDTAEDFDTTDSTPPPSPAVASQIEVPESSDIEGAELSFEPTEPALEAIETTEIPTFDVEDSAFEVEDSAFLPTEEPTVGDSAPSFDAEAQAEAEAIPMPDEPTLEELSGDITPEPELEDTSTGIWSLEEEDEDDEPTAVGQVAAQAPPSTEREAPEETTGPISPETAAVALGQQTVRLDIAALQGQMASSGSPTSEPPLAATAAPVVRELEITPVVQAPSLPEPVPVESPLAATPGEPDEQPTLVSGASEDTPARNTEGAGFASPSQAAYVPPVVKPIVEPEAPSSFAPPTTEVEPAAKPAEASETSQVQPPADLEGPGLAFSSSPSRTSDAEEALHEEARRLARLLVSEIKLYNEEIIEEGRRNSDVYQRLKDDIDRSRQMYEERIDPRVRGLEDYFHQELVLRLAGGDASLLGI